MQVLSLSIWTYKVPASPGEAKEQVLAASGRIARLPWAPKSQLWLPILALYTPVHIFSFVVASTFLLLPLRFAAALWVTGLLLYYTITLQGNPQHTGTPCYCVPMHTLDNKMEPAWISCIKVGIGRTAVSVCLEDLASTCWREAWRMC